MEATLLLSSILTSPVALAAGPALADRYVVIVGTAADPHALTAVTARVADRNPLALWSSDYARLRPCWHLVVVGAFPDAAEAAVLVHALKAEGIDAYSRFTGSWVADRPPTTRRACPGFEAPEHRFLDDDGAVRLGPIDDPAGGWPDRVDRVPLIADEVDGLRRGERLRVGDRICTVAGFEQVRACMGHATAAAVLAPSGCGVGGGVAQPVSDPTPVFYEPAPVPPAAIAALGDAAEVPVVRAPNEVKVTQQAWTGPAGLVVYHAVDVWTKREDDECGGMNRERTSATVLFPSGDPSAAPLTLLDSTDADVVGILDLNRDGRPEVWTEGADHPTTLTAHDGILVQVTSPFCTCGC